MWAGTLVVLTLLSMGSRAGWAQTAIAEHVVVIGVDGMSPDGIANAETPVMDALIAEGASTMTARAVLPTSSSPNWASMIMGAGPIHHGITSNGWQPDKHELATVVAGAGGRFPTIFSILRAQQPDAVQACFYDWGGFGRLYFAEDLNASEDTEGPKATTERACEYIAANKPVFTFIHLDHVDHAGHDKGHGTPEYYKAVEEADAYIGQVVDTLDRVGIRNTTTVLVTADHGGVNKGHGGDSRAEVEIPWILQGAGVKNGHRIETPVFTYDTAATIAHLLGLTQPDAWIARPVLDALNAE
jgi:predicted AlkP superfamily pyrophosphatase or phosphodiesterase